MILLSLVLLVGMGGAYHLCHRLVVLKEKQVLSFLSSREVKLNAEIPSEIIHKARQFQDDWARDAYMARAHELYEKINDWDRVILLLEDDQ